MSLLLRRYHAKKDATAGVEAPGGSASKKAWTEYALAEGKSAEELDGLSRDQIRDLFTEAGGDAGNEGQSTGTDESSGGTGESSGTGADEGADADKND